MIDDQYKQQWLTINVNECELTVLKLKLEDIYEFQHEEELHTK